MYKQFRELWLLVGGMVNSIKALAWICIILMLLIYVCAVVTTTEIGHNDDVYGNGPSYDGLVWPYKEYFGTVFKSMFSLFQVVTLDGWCDDIVRHIIYFQPILALLFLGFLVLTAFGLMNVVIGVIVENTLAGAAVADETVQKEQSAKRRKALGQLQVMLELSDTKRTGQITLQELQAAAQSRVVQQQFEALEVKQTEVEQIFELLDYERRGKVELKKFIDSCRELIGGQRRRDIAQVEITVGTLTQRLDSLDKKFSHIESEVSALGNLTEDFLQNTVRLLTGFDGSDLDMQPDWDR
jgi:voltage-gated sodium channel